MKTSSFWIIRIALTVQFLGVLAVPALVAAAEAPRATWLAEWVNPSSTDALSPEAREREGRTIGVLRLRDGQLTFSEQVGQVEWALDLSAVKRVNSVNGRTLSIETLSGRTYLLSILEGKQTIGSPRRAVTTIDRALQINGAAATASR